MNQSALYGAANPREWIEWSNNEIIVGIMLETEKALGELDGIMSVKGLDFVLIGPSDLSLSMGHPKPSENDPKIQDAIRKIIESARKHGKHVMISARYPWVENAKKYIDMGADMIELGHDLSVLRTVWSDNVKQLRM